MSDAAETPDVVEGEVVGSDDTPETQEAPQADEVVEAEPVEQDAEADVDAMQAEIAKLKDRLTRARADYDNLQKRQQRDAALERERVRGRVIEDFLQVYEYGKMAEFEADRNPGPLADGVKMVVREFDRLLETQGVRPIGKVGEAFDAAAHEACATEPGDDVEAGHVSRVIQPGYKLGDRILRHAKVAVAPTPQDD